MAELLGAEDAIVAVSQPARAVTLAGIVELGAAPVVLVATATAREADQLVHDLAPFLGADAVDLLPAWETLPFERVSPATETMGLRLRTMWRLRHGRAGATPDAAAPAPRIVVAPVRALLQRLGPRVEDAEPVIVRRGVELDPQLLVARLVRCRLPARVPGRAPRRARGSRRDRRRVPLDGRARDPDRPVRRRGRTSHRLRRRATSDRPRTSTRSRSSAVASWCSPTRCASAPARSPPRPRSPATSSPGSPTESSSTAWSPGCRGSARRSTCSPTCSTSATGSCSSSRAVCATGPRELVGRGDGARGEPGDHLADGDDRRRLGRAADCTSASTASLSDRGQGLVGAPRRREPEHRHRFRPPAGLRRSATPPASPAASASSRAAGNRVVVCADGRGSAERMASVLDGEGLACRLYLDEPQERSRHRAAPARRPRRRRAARPGVRCSAGSKLAVVGEPDVTGRRRPHRQARPRAAGGRGVLRRPRARGLRRAPRARRRPLRRHGDAGDRRRRARLPPARVPRRRQALRPLGPDRRHHAVHRRRGADAQPPGWRRVAAATGTRARRGPGGRPGARRALPAPPGRARPRASRPTRPGRPSSSSRSPIPRRPTSCGPSRT